MANVFDEKEGELLIRSKYLQESNDQDFNALFKLLKEKEKAGYKLIIAPNDFSDPKIHDKIKESKQAILKFSRDEWMYNKKIIPSIQTFKENQVCELCGNTTLREYHYVINKKTKERLAIGKDCANIMLNSEETAMSKYYGNDPILYEKFNKVLENKTIKEIVARYETKFYTCPNFPIVLSKSQKQKINRIMKKIIDRVKECVEDDDLTVELINKDEIIQSDILEYRSVNEELELYYEQHKDDIAYLTSETLEKMKLGRKVTENLVSEVEKNNGVLSGKIASQITDDDYLTYLYDQFNTFSEEMKISELKNIRNIRYYVIDFPDKENIKIRLSTQVFLETFGDRIFDRKAKNVNFKDHLNAISSKIEIDDEDTRNMIEILGIRALEDELRLEFNEEYLNDRYLVDNKDERVEVIVSDLINKSSYFKREKSPEIFLISNNNINIIGMFKLFSIDMEELKKKIINQAKSFRNAKTLDKDIYDRAELVSTGLSTQREFI